MDHEHTIKKAIIILEKDLQEERKDLNLQERATRKK
jgi:hypothetical protein